jgi:hypothetical protein
MSRWRGSKQRYRTERQKQAKVVAKINRLGGRQDKYLNAIASAYERRRQRHLLGKRNPANFTRPDVKPKVWKLADQTKHFDERRAKRIKATKRRRK